MSQPSPDGQSRVELSPDLRAALQRAHGYAQQQSHRFITVEHVLLALNEDPDAALILEACGVDQAQLHADISGYLGHYESRFEPGEANQPAMDPEASRIINSAVAASQKSGRPVVNGAIVLAAIIGDGRSSAANSLRSQGLTFEQAIRALQQAASAATAPSGAEPRPSAAAPQATQARPQAAPDEHGEAGMGERAEPQDVAPPTRINDGAPPQAASGATEDLLADARKRVEALRRSQVDERARRLETPADAEPDTSVPDDLGRVEGVRPSGAPGPGRAGVAEEGSERTEPAAAPPQADRPAQDPARRLQDRLREQATQAAESGRRPFDDEEDAPPPRIRPPQRQPQSPPHQAGPARPMQPQRPAPQPQRPGPAHGPGPNHAGERDVRPDPSRMPASAPPRGHEHFDPRLGPFAVGGNAADAPRPPPNAPPQQRAPQHQAPGPVHPYDPARGAVPAPYDGRPVRHRPEMDEGAAGRREEPSTGRQVAAGLSAGQLHENIPRKMRAWVPQRVEIRIARAEIANVGAGMGGAAPAVRHDIGITKAMSVRLRAPEGGFFIEQGSPETQWIESQIGLLNDEFASWRWTVTPTQRGRARLQLIVSARTVGPDGLTAESALPDQVIDVSVSVNYVRLATTWGGWIAAAIIGGLLAKFGEGALALGMSLLG